MYIDNSQRGSSLLRNHITIRPFFNAFVTPILFLKKTVLFKIISVHLSEKLS